MANIFQDAFGENGDPIKAARRAVRPQLPRRFYRSAEVAEVPGEFHILLDRRPAHTPARQLLCVPTRAIAEAVAVEWNAQAERIDPARMPLTRLVNSIIDGVQTARVRVRAEVVKYVASDLLFYRAEMPRLAARQATLWDPVLAWAREAFCADFVVSVGIVFAKQPETAVDNMVRIIPDEPWRLGALHSITTLTGSALLALAVFCGRLTPEQAWLAAHVDEDWNMECWGRDGIALQRREARFAEMRAAATLLAGMAER